ncbi:DUF4167 domain-containing protein [Oricola thermophila]|uniref:DUF4167 domain-containing protein n=1 Tax=Oricola thermophila TaxID=2742145 RepID=A0A6N1VIE9_9HYPH|nr:DUF4167 domain-containing protein [Oricola thermophila]QKV20203.1 DUF4167 domain-containing protein [Oricola thermophila]
MRPQQQGRRQRNRNSGGNNRRNQNPLSRNYESNGPDVKIRGNAQVIADKYAALARDALSSGDSVMAENYLQHAEHYNRIIMAAQAQMQTQREERAQAEDGDDDTVAQPDEEKRKRREPRARNESKPDSETAPASETATTGEETGAQTDVRANGHDAAEAPQPVIEETPVEVALEEQEQAASGKSTRRSTPRRTRKPRGATEDSAQEGGDTSSETGESVIAEV